MEIIDQEPLSAQQIGTVISPWRACCSRAWYWVVRQRRRLPYLVWYDDEMDVTVTFSSAKLSEGATLEEAMQYLFSGELASVEDSLRKMGVSFDCGGGFAGRDWEWDWSLKGPISIRFRGRARHPEKRKERQRPKLIFSRRPHSLKEADNNGR